MPCLSGPPPLPFPSGPPGPGRAPLSGRRAWVRPRDWIPGSGTWALVFAAVRRLQSRGGGSAPDCRQAFWLDVIANRNLPSAYARKTRPTSQARQPGNQSISQGSQSVQTFVPSRPCPSARPAPSPRLPLPIHPSHPSSINSLGRLKLKRNPRSPPRPNYLPHHLLPGHAAPPTTPIYISSSLVARLPALSPPATYRSSLGLLFSMPPQVPPLSSRHLAGLVFSLDAPRD